MYFFVSFSGHQTTSEEVLSEPWFLALLGSVVLTVLILIFVGIILYRKQWSRQKGLGQLSLPGIINVFFFPFLFYFSAMPIPIYYQERMIIYEKIVLNTYIFFLVLIENA